MPGSDVENNVEENFQKSPLLEDQRHITSVFHGQTTDRTEASVAPSCLLTRAKGKFCNDPKDRESFQPQHELTAMSVLSLLDSEALADMDTNK